MGSFKVRSFSFQEIQQLINKGFSISDPVSKFEAMKGALRDLGIQSFCKEKIILIAGTNGKGTTAKTLQTLLTENGKYVGLFTSPHLISICERIQIDGKPISKDLFVKCFHQVFWLYKKWNLGHAQVLTLMAAYIFFKGDLLSPVEYAIFEVGMGGKWDPTNVIPHRISIITQIGYDHQHILGSTLEEIAEQKLGIVHKNDHHVVALDIFNKGHHLKLQSIKERVIQDTNTAWHTVDRYEYQLEMVKEQPKGFIRIYDQRQEMNLLGKRAAENAALALKCYETLGFDPKKALVSLKKIKWEGRMHREDVSFCKCPVYFSGDHNQQGIQSLIDILNDLNYQKIYFLLSIGQAKDPKDILSHLLKVKNSQVYLTMAQFKGHKKEGYKKWLSCVDGYIEDPVQALIQIGKHCQEKDILVVTGSLYLVGELMAYIRK